MAQILVRNLEDDIKESLRSRAKAHGRSLEEEVRDILRAAVQPTEPEVGLGTQIMALFRDCPMPEIEEIRGGNWQIPDFSGPEYDPPEETG